MKNSSLRNDLEHTINNLSALVLLLCKKNLITTEELDEALQEMIKTKMELLCEINAENSIHEGDGLKA